jgi:hypothetical protein
MSNDAILVIAILKSLKLLSVKEARNLYDELKYKNVSTSLDDNLKMIDEAFKKHSIGKQTVSSQMIVGGKTIRVSK